MLINPNIQNPGMLAALTAQRDREQREMQVLLCESAVQIIMRQNESSAMKERQAIDSSSVSTFASCPTAIVEQVLEAMSDEIESHHRSMGIV